MKSVRHWSGTRQVPNTGAEETHHECTSLLDRRDAVVDSVDDRQRSLDELNRTRPEQRLCLLARAIS